MPPCDLDGRVFFANYYGRTTADHAAMPAMGADLNAFGRALTANVRVTQTSFCGFLLTPFGCAALARQQERNAERRLRNRAATTATFLDLMVDPPELFAVITPGAPPAPIGTLLRFDIAGSTPGGPGSNVPLGSITRSTSNAWTNNTMAILARGATSVAPLPGGGIVMVPASPNVARLASAMPHFAQQARQLFGEPLADAQRLTGTQLRYANATPTVDAFGAPAAQFQILADADGDGVDDQVDNCPTSFNPNQFPGTDGDRFGDCCDVCNGVPNTSNIDSDRDGSGDDCDCDSDGDDCPNAGMDPLGVACPLPAPGAVADQQPLVPNALVTAADGSTSPRDADDDGIRDDCDPDDDNDGILDDGANNGIDDYLPCTSGQSVGCDDNCREVCNSSSANCPNGSPNDIQIDSNDDGVGDLCDILCGSGDPPPFCGVDAAGLFDAPGPSGPGPAPAGGCANDPTGCAFLPVLNPHCLWDDSCSETGEDYLDLFDGRGDLIVRVRSSDVPGSVGFGPALAIVRDQDGDGIEDLAVGSPESDVCEPDVGCHEAAGEVLCLSSRDGALLWRWSPESADVAAGSALTALGGYLMVGAPGARDVTGARTGAVVVLDVGDAGPRVVRAIYGDRRGDGFGTSLSQVSDLDGDGAADVVLVGAPFVDGVRGRDVGRLYAVDPTGRRRATFEGPLAGGRIGQTSSSILPRAQHPSAVYAGSPSARSGRGIVVRFDWDGTLRSTIEGGRNHRLGAALSSAADYDGDGDEEIAAGAPGAFGGDGAVVVLRADGVVLTTSRGGPGWELGRYISSPGDVDRDGTPDLVVGAPGGVWPTESRPGIWVVFPGAGSAFPGGGDPARP